jgi:hypothetical protein
MTATTRRCDHGAGWPCPELGCAAGTRAARLVICGPAGIVYLARAIADVRDGRAMLRWAVEARDERAGRVAA